MRYTLHSIFLNTFDVARNPLLHSRLLFVSNTYFVIINTEYIYIINTEHLLILKELYYTFIRNSEHILYSVKYFILPTIFIYK